MPTYTVVADNGELLKVIMPLRPSTMKGDAWDAKRGATNVKPRKEVDYAK